MRRYYKNSQGKRDAMSFPRSFPDQVTTKLAIEEPRPKKEKRKQHSNSQPFYAFLRRRSNVHLGDGVIKTVRVDTGSF